MARLVVRQNLVSKFDNIGGFVSFGSVEGTDTVTINGLFGHEFGGFATQVFEKSTLNDGVKILFGFAGFLSLFGETLMFGDVARKPVMSALHSLGDEVFISRVDGLIESHMNISTDLPLGLHGDFWIHADFVAVDV